VGGRGALLDVLDEAAQDRRAGEPCDGRQPVQADDDCERPPVPASQPARVRAHLDANRHGEPLGHSSSSLVTVAR
jgi:hypothetical protein